ncbi:MAG: methyltransferase domain-containing protein [Bacteroidetes bacterium]|nr:methyltransferase domain-containing protein [Bacteroidota bacterium]
MNPVVISPLTQTPNTKWERDIKIAEIIKLYGKLFGLDIRYLFNGIEHISVYLCQDSGYRFYYPLHISGDERFYSVLSKLDWYYNPWKWEHEQSLSFINEGFKVLEVGAGSGLFLKRVSDEIRNVTCVGLEINSSAITSAKKNNVDVRNESIEKHSASNNETYDVVCSHQVLEHISDVYSFLNSQINCLKKGGKMIISVPNNDSFIKDNTMDTYILNTPPHHMGLWNEISFLYLSKLFNLNIDKVIMEPLQPDSYTTFQYTLFRKMFLRNDFLTRQYWRIHCKLNLLNPVNFLIKKTSKNIMGHTIMAIYTK